MEELTSIDYANLIQYIAQQRYSQKLNKTQVNKILFYVYGKYLAMTGVKLFTDDSPMAWPYGPVFPRVNKRINISEQISFSNEYQERFLQNREALNIVEDAVKRMYGVTAQRLTEWSHQLGSPWYKTIFCNGKDGEQAPWNTLIPDEYIKDYFK